MLMKNKKIIEIIKFYRYAQNKKETIRSDTLFNYVKKLQYPINIKNPDPKAASIIISQYGGPDGELGASLRYLSQRYSMPYPELKGLLTDIGSEHT